MIYYLDKEELPKLITPHDFVIKEVKVEKNSIIFIFEDDISYHDNYQDNLKDICDGAKSLIIRYNISNLEWTNVYKYKYRKLLSKEKYEIIDLKKLVNLTKYNKLEFLYQYLGYRSIIIKLWCCGEIILDIGEIDSIEYEWIK